MNKHFADDIEIVNAALTDEFQHLNDLATKTGMSTRKLIVLLIAAQKKGRRFECGYIKGKTVLWRKLP